MEKIYINPENWVSDQETLALYANGRDFALYGNPDYRYRIYINEDKEIGIKSATVKRVNPDGSLEDNDLKGICFEDKGMWEFSDMCIERENKDPRIAAAQVLFNLV